MIVQKKIFGFLGIALVIVFLLWFVLSFTVIPRNFLSMTLMFIMSMSLLGVIFLIFVDRILLSRLAPLASKIAKIRDRRDFAMRLDTEGHDELSVGGLVHKRDVAVHHGTLYGGEGRRHHPGQVGVQVLQRPGLVLGHPRRVFEVVGDDGPGCGFLGRLFLGLLLGFLLGLKKNPVLLILR